MSQVYSDYDYRLEARMRQNSTSGTRSKRGKNKVVVDKDLIIKRFKQVAAISVITGMIASTGVASLANKMKENSIVGDRIHYQQANVINEETHRTDDNEHYFYDYDDIADHIFSSDNPDFELYYTLANIGEYQTDLVLHESSHGSLDSYLSARGYVDIEDFKEKVRKQIILTEEISEKEQELAEMLPDEAEETTEKGASK